MLCGLPASTLADMLDEETVEKDDPWRVPQHPLKRLLVAVSSPVSAGIAVVVVALMVAIALVVLRPGSIVAHEPLPLKQQTDNSADSGTQTGGSAAHETVIVHLTGEVLQPGVVEIAAGARVTDAIAAAGGVTEHAALDTVNLARTVLDGEQIRVPHSSEAVPGGALGEGSLINLNQANASELGTLPQIGPALADRIIRWREEHGGFQRVEDVQQVAGIGPKVFAEIHDLVTAP